MSIFKSKKMRPVSLAEFYQELESHDWFHGMSDSHSVDKRGAENFKRLEAIAATHPKLKTLMDQYRTHMFGYNEKVRPPLPPEPAITDRLDPPKGTGSQRNGFISKAEDRTAEIVQAALADDDHRVTRNQKMANQPFPENFNRDDLATFVTNNFG